ncbi:MAG TPA: hypothetical protein VK492_20325 [Chitinophagaceae bacterium]|nr:hypothetical protein [Chitinophagaceae bacterium]
MIIPYQTIHSFFDSYGLVHARSILTEIIKKADSEKTWNRSASCDVLFFSERINELIEAVYQIGNTVHQHPEIILDKDTEDDIWLLTDYDNYCGFHRNDTPWDFFPRHLTKKEFLDPYKALEKFTRFRNRDQWKEVIRDLAYHALSDVSLNEFDDSKSALLTYIHLNKLIEAAHLIDIRIQPETPKPHRKWKDRKAV